MGSLPNLHELGREEDKTVYHGGHGGYNQQHQQQQQHLKVRPVLSNPCSHQVNNNNRNLHRHSTHCKGRTKHGGHKIVYDDFMLEQMATYSPISSRSTRNLTHSTQCRRRDSINSSIGANSVRKLIAAVRNTSGKSGPTYSRRILLRNLILLCVTHAIITAIFLPFLALQSSVSTWTAGGNFEKWSPHWLPQNFPSLLLTICYISASVSTILAPGLIRKIGTNWIFVLAYAVFLLFLLVHLYPILPILLPMYVIWGLVLGPLTISRITFLMSLSNKLNHVFMEEDEETRTKRRTCIIRRVARSFQAAQDFGLILGSILTALVITTTISNPIGEFWSNSSYFKNTSNETYLDIFEVDELGDRICGSSACPTESLSAQVIPESTSKILISIYAILSAIAIVLVLFLDKIRFFVYQDPMERGEGLAALRMVKESFKDVKLQLAAPLAVFIGLEQAFMFADFTKSYVVCTLGIHRVNWVFLSMGLLQSIAACTLSMLLRTIRRYYVIAVGFMFHACLLMVQMLWKPMGDDPALFYVISAAWGVCNAIWEMMNFTLLTGLYADNWEASFANSLFFRFVGLSVAFGVHDLLCNWVKVYFLAFWMLMAVIPFAWLERRLENMRRVKNVSRL